VEDAFDTRAFAFNRDDERAQRVAGLALMLMNASSPVPTQSVRDALYPDRSAEAFDRAFLRDRRTLGELGVQVEQVEGGLGLDGGWRIDPVSMVETSGLTDEEALVVDLMCQPLCSDPTFPFGSDLMLALAKVNNSFEDVLPDLPGISLAELPAAVGGLRRAFLGRVACDVEYRDAQGRESRRRVAVLGTFGLRGNLYFVTCPFGQEGLDRGRVRSLRADRVVSSHPVPGTPYEIPGDFCVDDYVRLPFQMGPATTSGRFLVPDELAAEVADDVAAAGRVFDERGRRVLEAQVADVRVAAIWAVSEGVVPLSPPELVDAFREVLEGVLGDVR